MVYNFHLFAAITNLHFAKTWLWPAIALIANVENGGNAAGKAKVRSLWNSPANGTCQQSSSGQLTPVQCPKHCWGFIDLCGGGSTTNDVINSCYKWQINWVAERYSFISCKNFCQLLAHINLMKCESTSLLFKIVL